MNVIGISPSRKLVNDDIKINANTTPLAPHKVFLATSGEQALKCIPKESPDLILLDYEMPEMNGKEVFEKIKADAYSKEIPVIFLTGVADKEHIYAVLQLNPAGYFLKPPNRSKLLEAIEGILSI